MNLTSWIVVSAGKLYAKGIWQIKVHGFDTFTGLPEKWHRDEFTQLERGAFDMEGNFPAVGANVNLVKARVIFEIAPIM